MTSSDIFILNGSDATLHKILNQFPERIIKGGGGENSHVHRLAGEKGSDLIVEVPTGITVHILGGAKLGKLLFYQFYLLGILV